jgi:DNA-binding NarL/FixJ family response regulator
VAGGEAIFSPGIAHHLMQFFAVPTPKIEAFPELTERESEVLSLIADGYTNTAIVGRLYLSPKTVRNYVSAIFAKLQVTDRAQAILRTREAGLGNECR